MSEFEHRAIVPRHASPRAAALAFASLAALGASIAAPDAVSAAPIVGSCQPGGWIEQAKQQAIACLRAQGGFVQSQQCGPGGSGPQGPMGACSSPGRVVPIGGDGTNAALANNATDTITILPKAWFKAFRMRIPSAQATGIRVVSIFVGPDPVLLGTGEISGEMFSTAEEDAGRIETDWIPVGQSIVITVRNVSGGALTSAVHVDIEGFTPN